MPEEAERKGWIEYFANDHEIQDVTPKMIDWWWDNMEKGYVLWHPTDPKGFEWEVPPGKVGHVGAIQIITQRRREGGFGKSRARWEDASECPVPIIYEHVLVLGSLGPLGAEPPITKPIRYLVHQYEATSYGTRMRSTSFGPEADRPPQQRDPGKHNKEEWQLSSEFLPQLYKMWQAVTDPAINVPCCLKVKKLPDGRWAYVEKNLPQSK